MSNPIDEVVPKEMYAFPWTASIPDGRGGTHWSVCPGMTLRDWFAGQALAGMLAYGQSPDSLDAVARVAYVAADAMLKARQP